MTDTTTEAEFDAARYKQDHLAACELVAAMHKAAVGETRGPIRGVVEDVADVRAALDRVTAELDRLSSLDTVTRHDSRADSFGVGARWAIRMIREAIARDSVPADGAVDPELAALLARCPAAHGALGRICELPAGHSGMHTGDGSNGGAAWEGDASA